MGNNRMSTKDIISRPEIRFWIPILTAIVGIAMSWAVMSTKIGALEDKDVSLETHFVDMKTEVDKTLTAHDLVLIEIQLSLAGIQKDIIYIREALE